ASSALTPCGAGAHTAGKRAGRARSGRERPMSCKAIGSIILFILAAVFAARPSPAQTLLLESARVISGDGSAAIENGAVLVERGMIARIGRMGDITAPTGAVRVDLGGKTVMPALVSTHVHPGFQLGPMYVAQNFKRETIIDDLNRALYFGVAAGMSPGIARGERMVQMRAEQAEGRRGGARLLLAGRGIGAPNAGPGNPIYANFAYEVSTEAEARHAVQEQAARRSTASRSGSTTAAAARRNCRSRCRG